MTDPDPRISHPSIVQPEDSNAKVWRYMDLPKLVYLLDQRALWYCQAARLGDPAECTLTEPMYQQIEEKHEKLRRSQGEQVVAEQFGHSVGSRISMYANCWCMLDHQGRNTESNALWKIYAGSSDGVAIVTTYRTLAELIPAEDYIGLIEYIDFDKERFEWGSGFAFVMHKRREYEYEGEVRVVRWQSPPLTPQFFVTKRQLASSALQSLFSLDEINVDWLAEDHPPGISVEVDVSQLVEEIVVSPFASQRFFDSVVAVVNAFDFEVPVRWSEMRATPRHHIERSFGPRTGELLIVERREDQSPTPDAYWSLYIKSWKPPPGRGLAIEGVNGETIMLLNAEGAIRLANARDTNDLRRAVQELLRHLMSQGDKQLEHLGDYVGRSFDIVRRAPRR